MAETSFASVICEMEILLVPEYMDVNRDDIIGAHIPSTDPLAVLTMNASSYELAQFIGNIEVLDLDSAELQDAVGFGLHISAEISKE